jgi:tetratricopeptide (TPR) repeat protein
VAWVEFALGSGDAAEALRRAGALAVAENLDEKLRWRIVSARAAAHELLGDLEAAIEDLETLHKQAERDVHKWPLLPVAIALARCYREAGDISRSIDVAERTISVVDDLRLEESDERAELAASIVASYYERGDLVHAGLLAKQLIDRVTSTGTRRGQAAAYWNASVVAQERGRVGEARSLAEKAIACLAEENQQRNMARLRLMYAGLLLRSDPPEPATALALIHAIQPALATSGSTVDLAYADTETARAHLQLGEADTAMACAEQALLKLGDAPRLETAQALTIFAQAARQSGHTELAALKARQAAQLLTLTSSGRQVAAAWSQLAGILVQLGERDEALRAYERAVTAAGVAPTSGADDTDVVRAAKHLP